MGQVLTVYTSVFSLPLLPLQFHISSNTSSTFIRSILLNETFVTDVIHLLPSSDEEHIFAMTPNKVAIDTTFCYDPYEFITHNYAWFKFIFPVLRLQDQMLCDMAKFHLIVNQWCPVSCCRWVHFQLRLHLPFGGQGFWGHQSGQIRVTTHLLVCLQDVVIFPMYLRHQVCTSPTKCIHHK